MPEIRIVGHAGQGVSLAGQLLAAALRRTGLWTHTTLACEGGCGGVLVSATVQAHRMPVGPGPASTIPDHLIVLEPALLAALPSPLVRDGGVIVVNAPAHPCRRAPAALAMAAVDATAIAARTGLDGIVGTAALGALAAVTGLVAMEPLLAAVTEDTPTTPGAHATACAEGYQETRALVETLRREPLDMARP